MSKKIIWAIVLMVFCFISAVNAEEKEMLIGTLYVNEKIVNSTDNVIFFNDKIIENNGAISYLNETLFPFRTIFEELGAQVIWMEETNDVQIIYKGKSYLCERKAPNDKFPENIFLYVKDEQNDRYIYLNPMGFAGNFQIINDRIYLSEDTGKRLFETFGCKVSIDSELKKVSISNQ